jgi:site-specific recombinase XerD
MLSLTWGDVMEHGTIGDYVTVQKKNTKGKIESKTLPLGPTIKEALRPYLESLPGSMDLTQPLFKSSQSDKPITRAQAHNVLKDAFRSQKLTGNCRTHSLRKSYCQRIHKALGEKIELTQVAMCHKSLSSTQHYLEVDRERVEKAIVGLG